MTITLGDIRKSIPIECFEKKLSTSIYYFFRDICLWGCSIYFYSISPQTFIYSILYWLSSGLFMWCLFMIGHDAGHSSFSNYYLINQIFGHLSHTPLLVPFATWTESHKRHHQGHNHIRNDYSYGWIPIHKAEKLSLFSKLFQKTGLYPIIGWFMYLCGTIDGGHWIPFGGRLWKENTIFILF